jgi:hypothetical protein
MRVYARPVLHGEAYREELGQDWESCSVVQAREKNWVFQGWMLKCQKKLLGRQGRSAFAQTS